MKRFYLPFLIALTLSGCAKTPPNLSPAGVAAFQGTQVIRALDTLRDSAILLNEQVPPIVSTDTTRKVVTYHKFAIATIHSLPAGWKPTVETGLTELQRTLPPPEGARLAPYFTLTQTLLKEVN